jgi:phage terminase large subunit
MASQNELVEAARAWRARYINDCGAFVRECLGADPGEWQSTVSDDLSAGQRLIAIRSARGRGKTANVAWDILWWLLTRFPQKTVVTAPAASTIIDGLWPEVQMWANKLPAFLRGLIEITSDRIVMVGAPAESFVTAKTARADRPEALQGIHSEHVLLIVDEASGVDEKPMEALSGSLAGDDRRMILIGNPTRTSGFFFDVFNHPEISAEWSLYQVSALPVENPAPNVKFFHCERPGDERFIRTMRAKYGEDSTAFRVHVLGEFPKADDDTVIPLHLVESARGRDVEPSKTADEYWGLDVARFGDDRSALVKRKGNALREPPKVWRGLDLMALAGRVKLEYDTAAEKPVAILVDVIGLGAGVLDRLRELKIPAIGINVSESPAMGDTYQNLRAELWFKAKTWFNARDCVISSSGDFDDLCAELVAPRYFYSGSGKLQIESKSDIKKRGLPSPDVADAFVLTLAHEAATATHGFSFKSSWNKPLKRNLSMV